MIHKDLIKNIISMRYGTERNDYDMHNVMAT